MARSNYGRRRRNVANGALNEKAFVNRQARIGHLIMNVSILFAYIVELIKGSRTWDYILAIALLTVLPVLGEYCLCHKKPDTDKLKYFMVGCFLVLYVFVLFTTTRILPFAYAVPMFFLVTLFSDLRFCILVGIVSNILNILSIVVNFSIHGINEEQIPDIEIRVILFLVLTVYLGINTVTMKKVNDAKLANVRAQKDETNRLLLEVLRIAGDMITNVEDVSKKMSALGESVMQIRDAMSEVNSGSAETAGSIQDQLKQTESIQNYIEKVKDTADSIETNMTQAEGLVNDGREKMTTLADKMKESSRNNAAVLRQMEELNLYTQKMNSIIETITNIANNTGMLALNAGIEAARAGEAGKGFGVVADEITRLANQTKSATVNITQLIGSINKELKDVSKAVAAASESNEENVEGTLKAQESFNGIANATANVSGQIRELAQAVEALGEANAEIVDKIQTISAITEQVSAHASETFDACEENGKMVGQVEKLMQKLNDNAQKLKAQEK
ncbi:MAG: hypothetical protein IKO41_03315 [Lachnospiraceae bacterium]|nr:hypothetical protein [Lachnospiraceae bacterium]MBR4605238.1 hypothetical protein [Lachnospiraceae bacterium]